MWAKQVEHSKIELENRSDHQNVIQLTFTDILAIKIFRKLLNLKIYWEKNRNKNTLALKTKLI